MLLTASVFKSHCTAMIVAHLTEDLPTDGTKKKSSKQNMKFLGDLMKYFKKGEDPKRQKSLGK